MGEELMRFKVGEGKKAITVVVKKSDKIVSEEEKTRQLVNFVLACEDLAISYMKRKIKEKTAFCFYCKKQITIMKDFYLHNKQDCCKKCYEKFNPLKKNRKTKN